MIIQQGNPKQVNIQKSKQETIHTIQEFSVVLELDRRKELEKQGMQPCYPIQEPFPF